jgi:hypothetical protein
LAGVLFLTQVWEHSILRAGLELAPGPVAAIVFAAVASRLGPRVGMSTIGAIGGLLVAAGVILNATRLGLTPDYLGALLPGQILTGAGVGLSMPAFTAVAIRAVEPTRFATAIGISSMFRQVGGALGVAAFVAIVGTPTHDTALDAYRRGWAFMAIAAIIGGLLMLAARFAPATAPADVSTTPAQVSVNSSHSEATG